MTWHMRKMRARVGALSMALLVSLATAVSPMASAAKDDDTGGPVITYGPRPNRAPTVVQPPRGHGLGRPTGTSAASKAAPASPKPCSSFTLDMTLLVISADGAEYDLPAIRAILDQLGTPYTLWVATQQPGQLTPGRLASSCHGLYQGVILATDELGYYDAAHNWASSALTDAEWAALRSYEVQFGVRQVSWFAYPQPSAGFNWPTEYGDGFGTWDTPITAMLTDQGKTTFWYVQPDAQLPITQAWAYLATPLNDGAATPLLTDGKGHALAVIHVSSDGRQTLAMTVDSGPTLIHNLVLAYGMVNWVTSGLFVGERHAFITPQVDDFFFANANRLPSSDCTQTNTGPGYRMTGLDLQAALQWQRSVQSTSVGGQFRMSFAFNGLGAQPGSYPSDTLTPEAQADAAFFRWINHSWDHANLDSATYTQASNEITHNNTASTQLKLQPYSVRNLVTPYISGLQNAAVLQAASDSGVRYLVTYAEQPGWGNPSPNAGITLSGGANGRTYSILALPRHETNLYFNVSTPDEWLSEYQCLVSSTDAAYADTYNDLLNHESQVLLRYLLTGDVDPLMFHQLNMRAFDNTHSILSDLLDRTLQSYSALVKPPVVDLAMDDLGVKVDARMRFDAARPGLNASLSWDSRGKTLKLRAGQSATIPITGLQASGSESYGGQPIAHIALTGNRTVTLTVQ